MKNYLTIVRKSDFTDLFKFGYLFIDVKSVVEFDGNIKGLRGSTDLRDKVFDRCNRFDYSFTVLLVHFMNNHIDDGKLYIEEVQGISAINIEDKRTIEISYDPRIRIDDPIWPEAQRVFHERFFYENAKKGARNVWKILGIEQNISDFESILPDEDIKEIVREVQNDKRPTGDLSFWIYLLRYERHTFFPKDAIGFFMDIIIVFMNTYGKVELSTQNIEIQLETSKIYKQLLRFQDRNLQMKQLIIELEGTEAGCVFFKKLSELAEKNTPYKHIPVIQIALLFLVLKSKFNEGFNLLEYKTLDYCRSAFPEACNFAFYLIGIYLGNDYTFECLYDTLPLPIFKPLPTQPHIEQSKQLTDISQDDITPYGNLNVLPVNTTHIENQQHFDVGRVGIEEKCRHFANTLCALNSEDINKLVTISCNLNQSQDIDLTAIKKNRSVQKCNICIYKSLLPAILPSQFNGHYNNTYISSTNAFRPLIDKSAASHCDENNLNVVACSNKLKEILNSKGNNCKKLREQLQNVLSDEKYQKGMSQKVFYDLLKSQPAWKKSKTALNIVHNELFNPS